MKKDDIAIRADPNDPEDFDVTYEGLDRGLKARQVRMTRTALGLSQPEFAKRFHIPVGTLRDWEQARSTPPQFAIAYIKLIARHPETVAREIA